MICFKCGEPINSVDGRTKEEIGWRHAYCSGQKKHVFKSSEVFVTPEELFIVNKSEFPLIEISKLIEKYHMPSETGLHNKTGEFFFEL